MTSASNQPAFGGDVVVSKGGAVTLLEVDHRAGIWEVTKDGRFYGHYTRHQPAFDAAEAAALTVVASGGAANVLWTEARPQQVKDPHVDPIRLTRTMEFRTGSAPIVR